MTHASELCSKTVEHIVERLGLEEVQGEGGGAFIPLVSQMGGGDVGAARVYEGGPLARLVHVSIVVPMIQMDSHMVFAFTKPESAVPHFTLDSVHVADTYAFHLDLIPRAELGVNLAYMDAAYTPLSEVQAQVETWEGLSKAQISPRQYAVMSPWMLVNRATEEAFLRISDPVGSYREHWLGLVESGIPEAAMPQLDGPRRAERDARHRSVLFNPDVDPVWQRVGKLLGDDLAGRVRGLLAKP